ncbi:MAG TPA: ATP-binding protein [Acidiferrobacteraceae bacterium]|nr:ATP-binding protein [Acidiferrobacteraceae bacterium]
MTLAENEQLAFFKAQASRYALYGVLIASASVLLATLLVSYVLEGAVSITGILAGQRHNIALRVLDIMPFLFAAWGQYASQHLAQAADATVQRRTRGLRLALDEARFTTRARTDFFAKMSHELRTPLNGILGTAELLSGTDLGDEQYRYARIIQTSAQSLLSLVNDLLDFSKIEAGHLHLEQIRFDLRECLEAPVRLLEQQARLKGLSLQTRLDRQLEQPLMGDPARLRQVLMNLVGNALKFTAKGGVTVTAEIRSEDAASQQIRVLVQDTGIGISRAQQKHIFEPYRQATHETVRQYGGTGLGLAISKELIEAMGGSIGVQSVPDQGSTFWFELTLPKAAPDAPGVPVTLRDARALLVDPGAATHSWIAAHLRGLGMAVEQVPDRASAEQRLLSAAQSGAPLGVVLIDSGLADNGAEQLARTLTASSEHGQPALILLSSGGQRGDAGHARSLGFCGYLTRPITRRLLTAAVTQALSQRGQQSGELITRYSLGAPFPRLLVVEDSAIHREIALHALAPHGYLVDFARNGSEGIEAARRRIYDLLLVDLQMPGIDGLAATEAMRALPNAAQQGAIVILTAGTTDRIREQCLAAGAVDVVIKPAGAEALVGVVERFVRGYGMAAKAGAAPDVALHQIFFQEADVRVRSLRAALAAADFKVALREAHTLKSTSLHLGAQALSAAAGALEHCAERRDLPAAQTQLEVLETAYQSLRHHLTQAATAAVPMAAAGNVGADLGDNA